MTISNLIRWSGPAAILGGVLCFFGSFLLESSGILWAAGFAFLVVGITGIYLHLRHLERFGLLGTVGFYMSIFAFVVLSIISLGDLLNLWGSQWLDTLGLLWSPWLILGSALFGVAILRARRLPRGGAWLLIVFAFAELGATLANIIAIVVFGGSSLGWLWVVAAGLFGVGWVWLGYGLWSESRASVGQPPRVS
jgi:hypothetical protein